MANTSTKKKTSSSSPAKSGAKSGKGGQRGSGASRQTASAAKKPTSKPAARKPRELSEKEKSARRQRWALLLFALSILLYSVVFIEGRSVWAWCHNAMLGFFGFCAYIWPALPAYAGFVLACDRPLSDRNTTVIGISVISTFLGALIHVAGKGADYLAMASVGKQIKDAQLLTGSIRSGGVFGALIGSVFGKCGKTPAVILLVIITAVALILVTGITIIGIIGFFKRTANKVGDYTDRQAEKSLERRDRLEAERLERERIAEERALRRAEKRMGDDKFAPKVVGAGGDAPVIPGIGDPVGEDSDDSFSEDYAVDGIDDEGNVTPVYVPDFSGAGGVMIETDGTVLPTDADVAKPQADKPDTPLAPVVHEMPEPVSMQAKRSKKKDDDIPPFEPDEPGDDKLLEEMYMKPDIDCLELPSKQNGIGHPEEIEHNSKVLIETLASFGVKARIVDVYRGPSVTRYELEPAEGVKISKITSLADDLALRLAASGVRIEAPIPNKSAIGIEIPNKLKSIVTLREIIDTPQFAEAKSRLNVALGKDITGNVVCTDIAKMPHLLVAGTTGSGKSVCLNSMIISILYNAKPNEVKLLMIDPKQVEFLVYNGIPHLMVPVISDARKAAGALGWAVLEMQKRYKTFSERGVRDITGYNKFVDRLHEERERNGEPIHEEGIGGEELPERMSQIVIFIDELSDLMMIAPSEVEDSICRLAAMARAAGMHLVIATQRPSVDVITGVIKANIPSRIALSVSSQVDSRTILDMAGAEKLLGYGDMLFNPVGLSKPRRVQGCFVSDNEVERVVEFIKTQEKSSYDDDIMEEIDRQTVEPKKKPGSASSSDDGDSDTDEMLPKAIEVVVEAQMASTTLLQRRLKLGYARAARIVDQLEERGIVGPFEGSKPRQVKLTKQQWMEMNALAPDKVPDARDVEETIELTEGETEDDFE